MHSAPCKDCAERHMACHGKCERYKAFKLEKDAENAANEKRRKAEDDYYGYKADVMERYFRQQRKGKRK